MDSQVSDEHCMQQVPVLASCDEASDAAASSSAVVDCGYGGDEVRIPVVLREHGGV